MKNWRQFVKYISNQWVDLLTAPFPYRKNAGLATKPEKKDVEGVVLFHTLVKNSSAEVYVV